MEENKQTNLEEVIEEVEQESSEKPKVENVTKVTMKAQELEPEVHKVDLTKPVNQPEEEQVETVEEEQAPVVEEVTEEEPITEEEVVQAVEDAEETGKPLPENIQSLVNFMDDTGGSLEDYVKLNRDLSNIDDQDALREYYQTTKPHLSSDEVEFLMEDKFSYDEDIDEAKDIKRKKLALKEQVAEAKTYLDGQKSKYYEEIKAGSNLTKDQQKAIDFFNRYNKESEQTQKMTERQTSIFNKKTEQVFNDKFKGFEYNVGDKRFRFNVNNADQVKGAQSDIGNFIKKFLNEEGSMDDARGYHKGLYTAMNADAIAQHFYEQGKADAIKDTVAKAKNINTEARSSHGDAEPGGLKFRVVGESIDSLKMKIRNKKFKS
tara:strand:- start:18454 stop:19581 length:1128 start_codon:yes stop_codon:yes gene_type:complete